MHNDLTGKRALVTGASSGLGAHFAGVLAGAGADVVLAARRADALDAVARALPRARTATLDVTNPASVEALFAEAQFDIVINNAGISGAGAAIEMERAAFDAVLETNLSGLFHVAQAAARGMQATGGSIINIASILGLRVSGHVAAYAASKAGVIQLTKALALEWARYGIRVNALAPGYIETPINADFFATPAGEALVRRIPQRRLGQPEDLDGPLLLLASDAGAYMSGTVIAVDGGHLVSGL